MLRKSFFGILIWGVLWVFVLSFYRSTLIDRTFQSHLGDMKALQEFPGLLGYEKINSARQDLSPWITQGLGTVDSEGVLLHQQGRVLEVLLPIQESRTATRDIYLFKLDATGILLRLALALVFGMMLGSVLVSMIVSPKKSILMSARAVSSLRTKTVLAMVTVNLISAGIIFLSLSLLQTQEQTRQIEKESLIFAKDSSDRVIQAFLESYEKAYDEKFLPAIQSLVASNEDLARVRIFSAKNNRVLFDSQSTEAGGHGPVQNFSFSEETLDQIAATGSSSKAFEHGGQKWFSVFNTFWSPTHDPLFRIQFLYRYRSLDRSLQAIRREIIVDLIPSLALGTLLALLFAQFLISPIRRLMMAFAKVSSGDYGVSVDEKRSDELGELTRAFNSMTGELRRKQELRKYLSNFSYEQITKAVDLVSAENAAHVPKIGGTRVSATILFCDIRDFVAHCEPLEAEEVTTLLNEYFSEMVQVIHKNGGEVDKFMGDAILAVFYPEKSETSEAATSLQSIYCALEMRSRLAGLNHRRATLGKKPLEIGIGISFGEIISGPIGAENRMDFTVIGDVVNVASRIEKLSKKGRHTRILFSDSIEAQIQGILNYEEMYAGSSDTIRGKSEAIRVFELIGIRELSSLVANLKSDDVKVRARSVEVLGQSGNREALTAVLSVMSDAEDQVRILVAAGIGKLAPKNDDAVIGALLTQIEKEKSPRVLSAWIAAVGRVCRNDRVLELESLLSHPDERIVANTIEAMGQARSARATDLILPCLESRNNRVKANAAMAAFSAGRVEVIDILKPMLMHSDALMRSSAAFAIGELTLIADVDQIAKNLKSTATPARQVLAELQECVPMLVALLKDPEPMVKRQAVLALGKIKDRGSVLPLIGLLETPELIPDVLDALRAIGSHRLVRDILSKMA